MTNYKRYLAEERIYKTLVILKKQDKNYDRKKFIFEIMTTFEICEKTAGEYLDSCIEKLNLGRNAHGTLISE